MAEKAKAKFIQGGENKPVIDIRFTEEQITMGNEEPFVFLIAHGLDSYSNQESQAYLPIYPLLNGDENTVSIYLHTKPGLSENDIQKYIERGGLSLSLSYTIPKRYLKKVWKKAEMVETRLQLVLISQGSEFQLKEWPQIGSATSVTYELSAAICQLVLEALQHKNSGLYLRSHIKFIFPPLGQIKLIDSTLSLSKLFRLYANGQQGSAVKTKYFYLDDATNDYKELAAKYVVNPAQRGVLQPAISVWRDHKLVSAAMAIAPNKLSYVPTHQLSHLSAFHSQLQLYAISNWQIIGSNEPKIFDYPIVNDNTKEYWVNRNNEQEYLAIPTFKLVIPQLNESPLSASFSFLFHKMPAMDMNGRPVLEGEIRLTVSRQLDETLVNTIKQAGDNKKISPVQMVRITYNLKIPYTDNNQQVNYLQIQTQDVEEQADGNTQIVFRLGNDAIRICYAAISAESTPPDAAKAQLEIGFCFNGYTEVMPEKINLANIVGTKIAAVPVLSKIPTKTPATYFDVRKRKLVKATGEEIYFKDSSTIIPGFKARSIRLTTVAKINPALNATAIHPADNLGHIDKLQFFLSHKNYGLQLFSRTVTLDCSFPCNTYGSFYQEETEDVMSAVGCREAYKLGEVPDTLYTEISELKHIKYKVFRSRVSLNNFLIVPASYQIARYSANAGEEKKYKPCVYLYSTINEVDNTSVWVLDMALTPDITLQERTELERTLKNYTPYLPEISFITEIPNRTAQALLGITSMTGTQLSVFPMEKGFRFTIQAGIESILLLLEMLRSGAIDGQYQFTLNDSITYNVELQPRLNHISGTWDSGHLELSQNNNKISFKNISESIVVLDKIRFYFKDNSNQEISVSQQLPSNGTATVDGSGLPQFEQVVPYYSVIEATNVSIQEINQYIEDVKCQLVFIATLDFNGQNVKSIQIKYRLKDTDQEHVVELDEINNNSEEELIMPLTNFLMARIIEFKIDQVLFNNKKVNPAEHWFEQDISGTNSNIINITSNYIVQS